ncbi:MAG: T9SS type A sorting domain-containing protein [Bacteroidota bacterium]|nr:T9SS type A sorting domain-containing protein [Bacteroidota bacterium]
MKKIYFLVTAFVLLSAFAMSQKSQGKTVKPIYGKAGITRTISELQTNNARRSLQKKSLDSSSIKPFRSYFKRYNHATGTDEGDGNLIPFPTKKSSNLKNAAQAPMAKASSSGSAPQIWSNFSGIDFYENPFGWPPDPNGAVSNSQIFVMTNNGIKVLDKPGVTDPPLVTPMGYSKVLANGLFITLENFFSAVIPAGSSISDPHVRYDRLSKRWFAVAIETNPKQENNEIFLAVSDGNKITGTSSFTFYSFNSSLFPYNPAAPTAPFLDFPTLGIDNNAVVIGGNQFGHDSLTNVGYVIDKNKLLKGNLVIYPFELGVANNITGAVGGMYTPQGVDNDDPSAKKSFFAGITYFRDGLVIGQLTYDKKHVPWLTETIVPVQPFNHTRDNSSPGGLVSIEQNDTRLLAAAIHKNKITGEHSLWTAHAVGADQQGGFISGSDSEFVDKGRTVSRWYEINNIYRAPTLNQLGTVLDDDQPSGRRAQQYFNPSIAANGQGNMVMGGTTDAFNKYINVFIAGHFNNDAKGSTSNPKKATKTTAIYAPYIASAGGAHTYVGRWGDFSQTVVDPSDDQTIWTFQEYADVDDSYGIRAVQVKAPAPATPLPLGELSNKTDTTITLKGISIDNSGFFDPGADKSGPGFNRLVIKATGNVIVTNLKFISPTSLRFKLNTKNQPEAKYSLIITNPDGQVVTTEFIIDSKKQDNNNDKSNQNSGKLLNDNIVRKYIVTSEAYPNPTTGQVRLQVNAVKDFVGKIILMNASGKVISQNHYNFSRGNTETTLSLDNLSNGTYIAAVYNQDNVIIAAHTIIKQ